MNSLVALLLLGQIIGPTLSSQVRGDLECNDKDSEEWAEMAVRYINKYKINGYKQTLNVIKNIHIRNWDGDLVAAYLKLNLLETECHVLDPTPVEKCTVRPQNNHAVKMDCDVKIIYNIETHEDNVFVKCISTQDSVENVQRNCPKCPILLPRNDTHVVDAVEYVLNKHNEKLSDHVYEVLEISRGQSKFEPEGYYVEFAIVQTNCTAQEVQDGHHHCHPNTTGEDHLAFCKATVFRSHASMEKCKDEKFESDCVILDVKDGHAHSHLIEQYLAHSHHHTGASHESHSDECVVGCPVAFVKKEVPTDISDHGTPPVSGCPGRVHHFML